MSEVDLARQKMGDRDFVRFVVIKRIKADRSGDASFIRMFKDEARITSELHHECIGQVYDFGRHGDEYYLALEYVPGIDVRGMINALRERQQRVPIRVALRILCDVLDALDYAHKKRDAFGAAMNIVHRDVNPRNVMISIHGETKLIDFGVAKAAGRLERTKTDHVKGKFSYMAPEQITGEVVDHRADLFAVGLTLHEFIAGYGPFFGLNQVQIVHRLLHAQIPEMPAVRDLNDDTQLRRAHDKALSPDPNTRYQSASEFRRDLETIAMQVGGLPSREQLARFLQKVDPGLTDRLQDKMKVYAQDIDVTASGAVPRPVSIDQNDDVSGTIDTAANARRMPRTADVRRPGGSQSARSPAVIPTEHTSTGTQFTSTGRTLVVGAVAGGMGAAVIVGSGVLVLLVLLWMFVPWPGVAEEIEPAVQLTVPEPAPGPAPVPVPVPVTEPSPEPSPQPGPEPVRPDPVRPNPVRPNPVQQPRPDPVPDPAPVVAPDPVPAPVPVVVPTPAPDPEPAAPDPSTFGTLKVASTVPGRSIRINGVVRGNTPAEIKLPPGTYTVTVDGYAPLTSRITAKVHTAALFK